MSLISTLKEWLFGTTSPSPLTSAAVAAAVAAASTNAPCRYLLDNSTSATFTLPDGRKLGYAQYGSPTGKAILYHHGFPGSRLEAAHHHELCTSLGLRIIAIDRPGHGWSTPHPGAKLLDWPKDVERLADHLELESYSVMVCHFFLTFNVLIRIPSTILFLSYNKQGVSGGAPSALACAFSLPPHKLKCVSLVCGTGPPDIGMRGADISHRIGWPYGIRFAPYWMGRWYWRFIGLGRTDLSESARISLLSTQFASVPESERDIYDDPDFVRLLVRATGEAFAQGYDGVWDDGKISCRDWGFRVQDIRKDLTVHLWYGAKMFLCR
jgi:hypothetical protein